MRTDNYFWLREKTNPKVLAYLDSENAYTAAGMRHTEALQDKLYHEMLGRIRETDLSVPYPREWLLVLLADREGEGVSDPLPEARIARAREEVYLDRTRSPPARSSSALGGPEVSPDGERLAYLQDTTALRVYTLLVKDLRTGQTLADTIGRSCPVSRGPTTTGRSSTRPPIRRGARTRCGDTCSGSRDSSDVKVFQDDDVLNNVGVARSKSGKFVLIADDGFTSSEWRVIPTADPTAAPRVIAPRRANVEYSVDTSTALLYMPLLTRLAAS